MFGCVRFGGFWRGVKITKLWIFWRETASARQKLPKSAKVTKNVSRYAAFFYLWIFSRKFDKKIVGFEHFTNAKKCVIMVKRSKRGRGARRSTFCAECQSYDTNTGKRPYHRAFLLKCVSTQSGRFLFFVDCKNKNEKISKNPWQAPSAVL